MAEEQRRQPSRAPSPPRPLCCWTSRVGALAGCHVLACVLSCWHPATLRAREPDTHPPHPLLFDWVAATLPISTT